MTSLTKFMALAGVACALLTSVSANATTFTVNGIQPGSAGGYGTSITKWLASYTDTAGAQRLTLDVAIGSELVSDDGFWLVLNNGGNPKNISDQLVILYGDVKTNRITAYNYNGQNSPSSYQTNSRYLATFNNAFTLLNSHEYTFDINVTALNNINLPNWKGIQFTDSAGIWFHASRNENATYNGNLITFYSGDDGYLDTDHTPTTRTPEPGSLALLGLGLAVIGWRKRRA